MANQADVLKPGDMVVTSGIYNVIHDKLDGDDHVHPHKITAMHGTVLPKCRACQDGVRYNLLEAVEDVQAHELFKTS